MKSKIDSIYSKHDCTRVCQGDILRDFEYVKWASTEDKKIRINIITLPYIVVLTQDCDLKWDFEHHAATGTNHDKFLQSILVCPAYSAEAFREGSHLKTMDLVMEKINSSQWNILIKNQNSRYHFLQNHRELQIPNLVIDFKHYYTIPRDILYTEAKNHYLGTINELFRESLSQRFAYYLSRIGLPVIKDKEE
ncbi:Uncharacterised protein [uncultured archaeon]|nr:Uncharacterised protein [uncultured archaeon]